jgi:predicted amidohydrolase
MIRNVGFFHFGKKETYDPPMEALRQAMDECTQDLTASLIVLPEAFNLGKHYWTIDRC